MRLDPKKVRFISPMTPGVFSRPLRFVGQQKTVQLQETALVVEGNLLKVGLLGLELLFRRALAEWSSVTIPYSCITRVRYVRFPLLRLLALIYLWAWPLFSLLVLLGPGGVAGALTGFIIGAIPALLAVYVLIRVPPRYAITFRTRDGTRTRLLLSVRGKKLRLEFAGKLREYRDAARKFRAPEVRTKRTGPGAGLVVGLVALLLLTASGVGYVGWVYVVPGLASLGPGKSDPGPSVRGPTGGMTARPPTGFRPTIPTRAGGTATPFAFEPLPERPGAEPRLLSHPKVVTAAVWLPDGRLATASDGAVRVWDLKAGRGTAYTLGADWSASLIALAPDSTAPAGVRAAFTSVLHGATYLWSVGSHQAPVALPNSPMISIAAGFDPTGRVLVLADGRSLIAWDGIARTELGRTTVTTSLFSRLDITPGGARVVAADANAGKVVVWNPGTGPATEWSGYTAAAVNPDGTAVAVRTAGKSPVLRLLDPKTGREVRELGPASGPPWLTYSASGRVLAGGSTEGAAGIGFWDSSSGRSLGRLSGGGLFVRYGGFSLDGSAVAVVRFDDVAVWRVPAEVAAAIRGEAPPDEIPPPRPVEWEPAPPPRPVGR